MKRVLRHLVPMAALWLAATASAQQITPGLWANTSPLGGAMGAPMAQMQQQMASMPPAQRKQMEAMLAQQGIRMDAQGVTSKVCITKEMAERAELPSQSEGDCKSTLAPRTGNTMKFSFVCTKPPSTGEGVYTFASAEAYTSDMKIISTAQGQPQTSTIKGSARWLSTDCGAVKPFAPPKK